MWAFTKSCQIPLCYNGPMELSFWVLSILIIVLTVLILIKAAVINPILARRLFVGLDRRGYQKIDRHNPFLAAKIKRLFWHFDNQNDTLEILRAIIRQQDNFIRYFCELRFSYISSPDQRTYFPIIMLAEIRSLDFQEDIYICRKVPVFAQRSLLFLKQESLLPVNAGLTDEFKQLFNVFSSNANNNLPLSLQQSLIKLSGDFPFNKKSGDLAVLHLTPEGWTLIDSWILGQGKFNDFLQTAEKISQNILLKTPRSLQK